MSKQRDIIFSSVLNNTISFYEKDGFFHFCECYQKMTRDIYPSTTYKDFHKPLSLN